MVSAILVGVLLSLLGGVAMNLAMTETMAEGRHLQETSSRVLAESGLEEVMAWFTHADLPASVPIPFRCNGTPQQPDVDLDAHRSQDDYLLNDRRAGMFRVLGEFGRITRLRLHSSVRPEGFCTVEVTGEGPGGVPRTVALELGAFNIPAILAAIQAGLSAGAGEDNVRVLAHWGDIINGAESPDAWHYTKFKDWAQRFGSYYVPDREGRLYRNGKMDPELAQTPSEVFGSLRAGEDKGLVFVDTVDQAPPSGDNMATLVVDAPYLEGTFYLASHLVLTSEKKGQAVSAWSPSTTADGSLAGRVPVTIEEVNIQGVLHVAGRLSVQQQTRMFGAVVAERGLSGEGLLEVWFNDDLRRGLIRGLPLVYPIRGTWREWGS
jgi:hypothetical protein